MQGGKNNQKSKQRNKCIKIIIGLKYLKIKIKKRKEEEVEKKKRKTP